MKYRFPRRKRRRTLRRRISILLVNAQAHYGREQEAKRRVRVPHCCPQKMGTARGLYPQSLWKRADDTSPIAPTDLSLQTDY